MKKIIICGNTNYTATLLKAIQEAAKKFDTEIEIICETQNGENLLKHAKNEKFPLFILDKDIPCPEKIWSIQDATCLSRSIREARKESAEQYGNPTGGKAAIIIYSAKDYISGERGCLDRFFSPNMHIHRNGATDEQIAELAVGMSVFNKDWVFPSIWKTLKNNFDTAVR